MSRARLFGGTLSAAVQEPGGQSPQIVFYHDLGVIINSNPRREQVSICSQGSHLFRTSTLVRSVQRLADGRHDSLVQVDSLPGRCLRRETHLSNPYAQTSKAREEFCTLPCQLGDGASKKH